MSVSDQANNTREKLLNTALTLIKEEGFEAVTIRRIAGLSGTNISLVNYYFGSKEGMISNAIQRLLDGFRGSFAVLDDKSLPAKERLKQFLADYANKVSEYPELVTKMIVLGNASYESQRKYGEFLRDSGFIKACGILLEITSEHDPKRLMMMLMQLFGAVFLPMLMKPLIASGTGYDPASAQVQMDLLFERYFQE